MESGATIEDAVKRETELLRPLRERADFVIDTTQLSAAKLRGELYRLFAEKGQQSRMSINVVSFGYKYGVPLEADLVFDVRFMPNPYYVPELRYQTGMNDDVYNYVFSFPQTKEFLSKLEQMLAFLLPLYQEEGKAAVEMNPGDCINIPAEVKHWHGAAPDSWFSHLAIEVPGEETSNEWCEPVTDEEYGKLQ